MYKLRNPLEKLEKAKKGLNKTHRGLMKKAGMKPLNPPI
jgi:hypothetical protein